MHFSLSWWTSLLYVFDFASLSTFSQKQAEQHVLLKELPVNDVANRPVVPLQVPPNDETVSLDGFSPISLS